MRPLKNINFLSLFLSTVVFVASFFISEINIIAENPKFSATMIHFTNAILNFLITLLIQGLIGHAFYWRKMFVFFNIKTHCNNKIRLMGVSQKENENISVLSKENYDIVKLSLVNYNEGEYPIIDFKFIILFWFTIKPRLIYHQTTYSSVSIARDENFFYDKKNKTAIIEMSFDNRVNHNVELMKDKRGMLSLEFSLTSKNIEYMKYTRNDSEKGYGGFIFCEKC